MGIYYYQYDGNFPLINTVSIQSKSREIMGLLDILLGSIGLLVAIWALNLQKKEIIKNGRISALIHASNLLQDKIDDYQNIVESMKADGKDYDVWIHTANRVNKEFKPLKHKKGVEENRLIINKNSFLNTKSLYNGRVSLPKDSQIPRKASHASQEYQANGS